MGGDDNDDGQDGGGGPKSGPATDDVDGGDDAQLAGLWFLWNGDMARTGATADRLQSVSASSSSSGNGSGGGDGDIFRIDDGSRCVRACVRLGRRPSAAELNWGSDSVRSCLRIPQCSKFVACVMVMVVVVVDVVSGSVASFRVDMLRSN